MTRAPEQKNFEHRLGRQLGDIDAAIRRDIARSAREMESAVQREITMVEKASEVERAAIRLEIVRTCGEMEAAIRSCIISNTQRLEAQVRATADAVTAWQSIQPTLDAPPAEATSKAGRWQAGRGLDSGSSDGL